MWFYKISKTDIDRFKMNISKLESLKSIVHKLSDFVVSSNSGGYEVLKSLLDDNLVHGYPLVFNKLQSGLIGENNQKIALDSPSRFKNIMIESEQLIQNEIVKESRKLKKLEKTLETKQKK